MLSWFIAWEVCTIVIANGSIDEFSSNGGFTAPSKMVKIIIIDVTVCFCFCSIEDLESKSSLNSTLIGLNSKNIK